jgi:DNA polymerase-3 subunit alpha
MRWEKELLGLYLSGHPMGDLAAEVATFVDTYSGDLGEEIDQQRVVVGGVVTGIRRVLTKARQTMAVATLEDLQGSMEVVVFPKVFEETGPTWAGDAILLVAGRVDHKGDETVLLADTVWTWEQAIALSGPTRSGSRSRPAIAPGAADGTAGTATAATVRTATARTARVVPGRGTSASRCRSVRVRRVWRPRPRGSRPRRS